jgi:hypothetical protein
VVREQDWLGALRVGKTRDDDVVPGVRSLVEDILKIDQCVDRVENGVAQKHAQVEGNLIVAATSGVQLSGNWANDRAETRFDVGMNVFEGVIERNLPPSGFFGNLTQATHDVRGFFCRDYSLARQHSAVGDTSEYIRTKQPTIEVD